MPEIAEVRVVANTLKRQILNKKITSVKVLYPNIIMGDISIFIDTLCGKTIEDVRTCGKWIIFDLDEYSLLSHLRMEGKYFYESSNNEVEKHTHVIISFDNGMDLRYNDVRKFGKMLLVKSSDLTKCKELTKLGLEPDDDKLSTAYVLGKLKNKKKPIKTLLLDQSIINGLGNIYANEVLFASKINPLKKGCEITEDEARKIIKNSKKIISKSFELGGCTIRSYTSSLGVIGHYQDELKVHGKENEKCPLCGNRIKKIKIDGRSTYYCEFCQK